MKRKSNLFERIKQTRLVDEDNDIDWWLDDEDLEDYADWYEDDPDTYLKEKREISAHEWNKLIVGSIYDDHQGYYLDEDCPECEHFLVHPAHAGDLIGDEVPCTMKHCSNFECKYATIEFVEEQTRADELDDGPKREWTKLRLVNETISEFCNRNKVSLYARNGGYVMDKCVVCKKAPLQPSDWYQTKDYAVVEFKHEGCDNSPATMAPQGDKAKFWKDLLF